MKNYVTIEKLTMINRQNEDLSTFTSLSSEKLQISAPSVLTVFIKSYCN